MQVLFFVDFRRSCLLSFAVKESKTKKAVLLVFFFKKRKQDKEKILSALLE